MEIQIPGETRRSALQRHIRRVERRLEALHRTSNRYGWARLALFVAALVAGAAGWRAGPVVGLASAAPLLLAFFITVFFHRRVDRSLARHEIWRQLKQMHLARMNLDWAQLPAYDAPGPSPSHPFEADLDLVGEQSLHHLLDVAISREGSQRLREWLTTTTPDFDRIERRQALVRELAPLVRFHDTLLVDAMVAGSGTAGPWENASLLQWFSTPGQPGALRPWLALAATLSILNGLLLALNFLGLIPAWWLASVALIVGLYVLKSREIGGVFDEALRLDAGLRQLVAVFKRVERHSYRRQPHLRALCEPFLDPSLRPSKQLQRMSRLVAAAGLTQNPALKVLVNLVVPWDFYFAHRLKQYRVTLATQVPVWLDRWFELEALISLATFSYLHPTYTFPTIHAGSAEDNRAPFHSVALGHPLIPGERRVCNDFTMDAVGDVVVVTGSNMAGKSSFLRTVGVNLCLAYAGAPVVARALETRRFRLFTSIRVSDSVIDGISYFYAEVVRLRALLTALEQDHPLPLFFLIDEIFRGTNNRERLIGSRAYLRAVTGRNGLGILATHDLELAALAETIPSLRNYHFREFVQDGRMHFDYRLRPGPCPTTNALRIMEMAGLPVD